MDNRSETYSQSVEISIFRAEDAAGVGKLFRRVYGEAYPNQLVYDPAKLVAAFENGENIPVVARAENGDVIGYESIYRSSPNPRAYEAGQGLILPEWRGGGLGTRINQYVCDQMVPRLDIEVCFGEAVCNHVYMQKSWAALGPKECALEVDLMPAEAYAAEGSAKGRVATLFMGRVYRPREQTVYLPQAYEQDLRLVYSAYREGCTFKEGRGELPGIPSEIKVQVFDFAQVARFTVGAAGSDFEQVVAAQEPELERRGIVVYQVWLNLAWPFIDALVGTLNRKGYFFGGLLPRWYGSDGLLMQRIGRRPNWEGINLYSEMANAILESVRGDWAKVTGER